MTEQHADRWRYSMKQLGAGAAVLVVALAVLAYNWRWIRSVLHGPLEISKEALQRIDNPAAMPNPYIKVPYDEVVETNWGVVKRDRPDSKAEANQTRFLLVRVQDSWLLAECTWYSKGKDLIGYLDVWQDPLHKEAITRISAEFPEQTRKLLAVHLDADYEYRGYCYFLMGGIGLAILVGAALVLAGLMSMPWNRGSASRRPGPARGPSEEDEAVFKPKPKKRKRFRDHSDD